MSKTSEEAALNVACGCGSMSWRVRFVVPLVMHVDDELRSVTIGSPDSAGIITQSTVVCDCCGTSLFFDDVLAGPMASASGQREAMAKVRDQARASSGRVPTVTLRPSASTARQAPQPTGKPAPPVRPDGAGTSGIVQLVSVSERGTASLHRLGTGVVDSVEPVGWPRFRVAIRCASSDGTTHWVFADAVGGSTTLVAAQAAARSQQEVMWTATWERLPWDDSDDADAGRQHGARMVRLTSLTALGAPAADR